jgi:hypothetical protein
MASTFSEFEKWSNRPILTNDAITNITYKFTKKNDVVVYIDSDNDFNLLKALILKKSQIDPMLKLRKKFIDDYLNFIEIVQTKNKRIIDNYKQLLIIIPENKFKNSTVISEETKQRFRNNLMTVFSFLNNSSIWVRVVDEDEQKSRTKDGFKPFDDLELYKYGSAKENFDFNCRNQSENWLEGDHGHDVTPILYGNESEFYEILFG